MNFLERIDVLILTFNEAANLGRTLDALRRFPRIVVLDSGSTDATLAIAARYPNVTVRHRAFDSHSAQWNHGIESCGLAAEWVLALDADYLVPPAAVDEIAALSPPEAVTGYRAGFGYCVAGAPLAGAAYPPVVTLYRREGARYRQEGHTQRVTVAGDVSDLREHFLHDDRKPLSAWLAAQDRYARLECGHLRATPWKALPWQDRLRKCVWVMPWLMPLYCLVVRRGLLSGRRGLHYALQRAIAETLLSLRLIEAALAPAATP